MRRTALVIFMWLSPLVPAVAQAHGSAQWIQDGAYKGGDSGNVHCCSPTDCHVICPAAVQWEESTVTVIFDDGSRAIFPKLGVHPSKDMDYWACATRCLFLPTTAGR